MKYSEINEAPVGNLEVHGMDQSGTFPHVDRKLLSNSQHIERIRKHFENSSVLFDLYFANQHNKTYVEPINAKLDSPRQHRFTDAWHNDSRKYSGVITPDVLASVFGLHITPDQDAISVAYVSNANEENTIPMTPWMVAHRFAHSLTDTPLMLPNEIRQELAQIPRDQKTAITRPLSTLGVDIPLYKFMTNRSARTGVMDPGESIEELIAQYITTGRIRLAIPQNIKLPIETTAAEARLRQVENRLMVIIDRLLNECIGHIFLAV